MARGADIQAAESRLERFEEGNRHVGYSQYVTADLLHCSAHGVISSKSSPAQPLTTPPTRSAAAMS